MSFSSQGASSTDDIMMGSAPSSSSPSVNPISFFGLLELLMGP